MREEHAVSRTSSGIMKQATPEHEMCLGEKGIYRLSVFLSIVLYIHFAYTGYTQERPLHLPPSDIAFETVSTSRRAHAYRRCSGPLGRLFQLCSSCQDVHAVVACVLLDRVVYETTSEMGHARIQSGSAN